MTEFSVWGGYSYTVGTEEFASIEEAAATYLRRLKGYDNGVRFPLWGDMNPDDYAITDQYEGWTIADLEAIHQKEDN
jgi:hypothetical protein